jgi:hypothetical protein
MMAKTMMRPKEVMVAEMMTVEVMATKGWVQSAAGEGSTKTTGRSQATGEMARRRAAELARAPSHRNFSEKRQQKNSSD